MNLNLTEKFIDHRGDDLLSNLAREVVTKRDEIAYNIIKPYVDKYGKATQVQMICDSLEEPFIFRYLVEWGDKYSLTFTVKLPIEGM